MEIAKRTEGNCRMRWYWNGKHYTGSGVEVPQSVIDEDDARVAQGLEIAPDDQVLDMKVTLPAEAVPPPYSLETAAAAIAAAAEEEEEEEEVEEEVEEDTPEGKVTTKKTVKRKKAAKRK